MVKHADLVFMEFIVEDIRRKPSYRDHTLIDANNPEESSETAPTHCQYLLEMSIGICQQRKIPCLSVLPPLTTGRRQNRTEHRAKDRTDTT